MLSNGFGQLLLFLMFVSEIDVSRYEIDINTTDFMLSTAHDKSHLIERYVLDCSQNSVCNLLYIYLRDMFLHLYCRCTWHGNPCDKETDFVTTLTDLGVCYTFNMKEPALEVTEPGLVYLLFDIYCAQIAETCVHSTFTPFRVWFSTDFDLKYGTV